jgi:hypothetical protein
LIATQLEKTDKSQFFTHTASGALPIISTTFNLLTT